MINSKAKLAELERRFVGSENLPYEKKLALFEEVYKEAVSLGIYKDDNILDGLDVVIRVAKTIHSMSR